MTAHSSISPVSSAQVLPTARPTPVEVFHNMHLEMLRNCLERRLSPWLYPANKAEARREARHHIRLMRQYRGAMV